jgi:hypothetical protein
MVKVILLRNKAKMPVLNDFDDLRYLKFMI